MNAKMCKFTLSISAPLEKASGDQFFPLQSSCDPSGSISRVIYPIGEQVGAGDDNMDPSRPQAVQHGGRQRS
jgi:hypothetical protein